MVEAIAGKRPLIYDEHNLSEKAHRNHSFSFKSNLLREIYRHFEISFGTRTTKSDLLKKITEMVVECSCAVKKIVAKDTRAHCEFTAVQENHQLNMCIQERMS